MEFPASTVQDEGVSANNLSSYNGTFQPEDSIIVRSKETRQPLKHGILYRDVFTDEEFQLRQEEKLPSSQSSSLDLSSMDKSSIVGAENKLMKPNMSMTKKISDLKNSYLLGKSNQFACSLECGSTDGTERDTNNQNNISPFHQNRQHGSFGCDSEKWELGPKKMYIERASGMDKESLRSSNSIYRNESGESSHHISPCSAAISQHQDLDPTQYGPNGNLDNRCEICGKTFSQPYLLKVHFRIHSGFKPYICDLCNKGFAQSSGLRSHKLTHTGEKPYKCDICDKTFTASGSLTMHYRTHNGERPFSCEVCGRSFRYRSAMNKHMMIHTGDRPFTCEDCGKDFSRKGNLETHRRIHTNSMPYECEVCKKKFNQLSNLRTHQMTHTHVKPYKCDLCGSEFFTKFNMQRHIVIQHIKNKK